LFWCIFFVISPLSTFVHQYYYYTLLDGYELQIPRLPNSHHSHHGSIFGWMVGYRGLLHALFPRKSSGQTESSAVLFIPNLLVCWLSSIAVVLSAWRLLKQLLGANTRTESPPLERGEGGLGANALFVGWCLHLLPFFSVHRELFIVYYAFAYFFAIILLGLTLDRFHNFVHANTAGGTDTHRGVEGWKLVLSWAVLVVPVCGSLGLFMWMYPLTTGHGITPEAYLARLSSTMPSCWFGECFNAVPGSPLRSVLDNNGGDEKALFPFLLAHL
jgi:hypothetical protein